MEPLTLTLAILGIVATFVILAAIIARVDGLTFLGPKSTRGIRMSARLFCSDRCRVDGECPLTGSAEAAEACPLWKYIDADVDVVIYGSPFKSVHT
jgi:hypothetical protein